MPCGLPHRISPFLSPPGHEASFRHVLFSPGAGAWGADENFHRRYLFFLPSCRPGASTSGLNREIMAEVRLQRLRRWDYPEALHGGRGPRRIGGEPYLCARLMDCGKFVQEPGQAEAEDHRDRKSNSSGTRPETYSTQDHATCAVAIAGQRQNRSRCASGNRRSAPGGSACDSWAHPR